MSVDPRHLAVSDRIEERSLPDAVGIVHRSTFFDELLLLLLLFLLMCSNECSNRTQGRAVLHNLRDGRVVVGSSCACLVQKENIARNAIISGVLPDARNTIQYNRKKTLLEIQFSRVSCLMQDWHVGVGEFPTKVESCVRSWSQQGLEVHLDNNNNKGNDNTRYIHLHINFFLILNPMNVNYNSGEERFQLYQVKLLNGRMHREPLWENKLWVDSVHSRILRLSIGQQQKTGASDWSLRVF